MVVPTAKSLASFSEVYVLSCFVIGSTKWRRASGLLNFLATFLFILSTTSPGLGPRLGRKANLCRIC